MKRSDKLRLLLYDLDTMHDIHLFEFKTVPIHHGRFARN